MSATFGDLLAVAAVDPVPWARSQMAFTLAFHIILVPLGRLVGVHDPDRQLPGHQATTTGTPSCSPSAGRSTWR